jgi:hypothetical protein
LKKGNFETDEWFFESIRRRFIQKKRY